MLIIKNHICSKVNFVSQSFNTKCHFLMQEQSSQSKIVLAYIQITIILTYILQFFLQMYLF